MRHGVRALGWWAVGALASFMVLWGPAASAQDEHRYTGAERCGSCHLRQLEAWRSGPHADTLRSLTERQARDPSCASCHTMVRGTGPELSGVQCESCHGPGEAYAPAVVMRDPVLARLMGLEEVDEQTCGRCHQGASVGVEAFSYARAILQVCQNRLEAR